MAIYSCTFNRFYRFPQFMENAVTKKLKVNPTSRYVKLRKIPPIKNKNTKKLKDYKHANHFNQKCITTDE